MIRILGEKVEQAVLDQFLDDAPARAYSDSGPIYHQRLVANERCRAIANLLDVYEKIQKRKGRNLEIPQPGPVHFRAVRSDGYVAQQVAAPESVFRQVL